VNFFNRVDARDCDDEICCTTSYLIDTTHQHEEA